MKIKSKQYRLLTNSSDQLIVRFDKDRLKEISEKQNTNIQLEVIENGKLGYASSTNREDKTLEERAVHSAMYGPTVKYNYPKKETFSSINTYSKKVASLDASEFIETGNYIIDAIKKINAEILVSVFLKRIIGNHKVENSAGVDVQQNETGLLIEASGELVTEGDILQIDHTFYWGDKTFDKELFVKELQRRFILAQTIREITSGKYPVMFTPRGFSTLLDFLDTALSAETVYRKISKWTDALGKEVTDSRFTMIDDPTIDFAPSSTSFDDEGFSAKPLTLIEKGIVRNFYTDLKRAERLKIAPNGRGFGIPASPQLTNVIVTSGNVSSEDMLKHIEKGIIIDQVIGGGQDSPYSGDFTLNIHLGFLIENGKMLGRVKNCLVSGNVFEMMKNNIAEISSEKEWVINKQLPYISFRDVTIVGK